MISILNDAHSDNHTPQLIVKNPDNFQITDVVSYTKPHYIDPEHTTIYFSYEGESYLVTNKYDAELKQKYQEELEKDCAPDTVIFSDRGDGTYILLYKKTDNEYRFLDYVFDSFTYLHRLGNQKKNLLIRLTDIKLIGGALEAEVEQLHKNYDELQKQLDEAYHKLYPE